MKTGECGVTLQELLERVPDTTNQKLPTTKYLRKSGATVLQETITKSGELRVYENGYFTYTSGRRTTVQSVYECRKCIRYYYGDGSMQEFGMETFGKLPYEIRLTLEGEARLEQNQFDRDEGRVYSYDSVAYKDILLQDGGDFVDEAWKRVDRETLRWAVSQLTANQRQAIDLYYLQGLSQQAIADRLKIDKSSVRDRLDGAIRRLQKLLDDTNVK